MILLHFESIELMPALIELPQLSGQCDSLRLSGAFNYPTFAVPALTIPSIDYLYGTTTDLKSVFKGLHSV